MGITQQHRYLEYLMNIYINLVYHFSGLYMQKILQQLCQDF